MRNVDLGWIRVFVEVARVGTLSEAARNLNLTQPAVSYQIRRAETELGVALLHRLHRGVQPTEAGARLYDILSRTVVQVDDLALRIRRGTEKTGLRVLTDYAFSALWMIPRMHEFRETYPDLDLQIVAAQRPALAHLEEGDIAVAFGSREDMGAEAILLMPETVVPVCAPDYEFRGFAHANLIHLDSASPAPWFDWAGYLDRAGLEARPAADGTSMRFNTYSLVIEAASAGQGVALGWRGLVDFHLKRGTLIEIGPELTAQNRGYFLLEGKSENAVTSPLRDWLLSYRVDRGVADQWSTTNSALRSGQSC
ncbi:LysR substrate-binding domain-containing protein [Paracoccus sp. MBLB3053]|uniref:LysR substrate-binding domain-containing protein n=1 Tax=Paracoccus aurantius TaxID=3073814 RepID=A0ABU2HWC6_9RHOB|nr:LysR substrate-binding domain-containing protein [Paracoccus sp. MBLB3053]MDS9469361.1 LysR substrate-binding domain-containing protein [Paracoccus sp. MBLB3053]